MVGLEVIPRCTVVFPIQNAVHNLVLLFDYSSVKYLEQKKRRMAVIRRLYLALDDHFYLFLFVLSAGDFSLKILSFSLFKLTPYGIII